MPRRWIAIGAMVAVFAAIAWAAAQAPDDSDAGAQWERVEPAEPAEPPPSANPAPPQAAAPQAASPELCESLGTAVGRLAMLRDKGVSQDQLQRTVGAASANGDVARHVTGYIAYVYDHPEMSPAEIKAQVAAECARPHP